MRRKTALYPGQKSRICPGVGGRGSYNYMEALDEKYEN
jgi:hypothetical protein